MSSQLPEVTKENGQEQLVKEATVVKGKSNHSRVQYNAVVFAVFVAIGGVLFGIYKFAPESLFGKTAPQQQRLLVLDTKKIMAASIKQIMANKELNQEQVNSVSQKLALNMQKLMTNYHDQGFIVLNSSSLLTWPGEIDITKQFADDLGVKLE